MPKPVNYRKIWGHLKFQTVNLRKYLYEEEVIVWVEKSEDGEVKFTIDQSLDPKDSHEDKCGILLIKKNKFHEELLKNYKITITKNGSFETVIDEKAVSNGHENRIVRMDSQVEIKIDQHVLILEHRDDIYLPDAILEDYELMDNINDHKELYTINKKDSDITHVAKVIANGGKKKANRLLKEIKLLERAGEHANIIQLISVDTHPLNPYLILQYGAGGTLCDYMYRNGIKETEAKQVFKQVLSGISYLHKKRIVHRDIKPENIVLMSPGSLASVKIIDFGLSCKLPLDGKLSNVCGTPYFASPQIMRIELEKEGEASYSEKTDVWSFGVSLYDFLVGEFPFDDTSKKLYYEDIMNTRLEIWKKRNTRFMELSSDVQRVIIKCLRVEENKRPGAAKLIDYRWFSSIE